jgi:hypothetical protein
VRSLRSGQMALNFSRSIPIELMYDFHTAISSKLLPLFITAA